MRSRLLGLAFVTCLALFGARDANADGMRIAVVNVSRAVMNTEDGLRATATLKKLFDQRQQELNKKQTDIEKQSADLEKQAKVLSKESYVKKKEELQKQILDYQSVAVEFSKELEKKQNELTGPIVEKMLAIVKRTATTENFDLVVDSSPTQTAMWGSVAYARTDLDLTDKCIQMYNSSGGGAGAPVSSASATPPPKK